MAYGIIKVDTVTFTDAGIDKSVSLSGLVQNPTFSGNVTVTGTLSGVTVTGTTASFTSGVFTSISGATVVLTSGVFASGTAAAPSVSVGTTSNGIYSPGTNQLALSTNGTGRLFVDASGNVQIAGSLQTGVTATTGQQQIRFNTQNTYAGQIYSNNLENLWLIGGAVYDGTNYVANTGTTAATMRIVQGSIRFEANSGLTPSGNFTPQERLRITSAGLVGIGTSAPSTLLHLSSATGSASPTPTELRIATTTNASDWSTTNPWGRISFYSADTSDTGPKITAAIDATSALSVTGGVSSLDFKLAAQTTGTLTSRLFISPTGNVGIGTTSPVRTLEVKSTGTSSDTVASFGNGVIQDALQVTTNGNLDWGFNALNSRNLTFSTNQQERARIDSSGRLLVGTSTSVTSSVSQQSLLQVYSTSSGSSSVQIGNYTNGTNPAGLHFDKSRGSLGVNTILQSGDNIGSIKFNGADGTNLIRAASIDCAVDGTPGANDMPGRLVFSTTADGASSPTERMRITQDGNFYFNNTNTPSSTQYGTRIGGGSVQGFLGTARNVDGTNTVLDVYGNAGRFRVLGNGNAENTNNSYTGISDLKLKENIADANPQWSDIKALQVRNYNFKAETGFGTHTQIGLIAQEVELVSPGLVSESPDRDENGNDLGTVTKSVNYSVLYMKAVKALQEAMERIETLEAKVAALESA